MAALEGKFHNVCNTAARGAKHLFRSVDAVDARGMKSWAQEVSSEGAGGPPATSTVEILRESPNLWIGATCVAIVWDEPMPRLARPFFECPICSNKCRFLHLRGSTIGCRKCLGLDYSMRHINRQVPALARVVRLRRKLGDCPTVPFSALPTNVRSGRGGRSRSHHDQLVAMIRADEERLIEHIAIVNRDLSRRVKIRGMLPK